MSLPSEHYSRPDVQREIAEFCRNRWVGIHCADRLGELRFRRYLKGRPLTVNDPSDVERLQSIYGCTLRSIYATANLYRRVDSREDVYTLQNIVGCTPTWDIDSELDNWRETVRVAGEIVSFLRSLGLERSLYLKWSGNGCHIHIHEEAISEDLTRRYHPLDLAYAIVEYVNSKLYGRFIELMHRGGNLRVENKMDLTRVFTAPLSLHRKLDVVCICMKPDQLGEFSPEWITPGRFRHNPSWREFSVGEADELALRAYRSVGGYPLHFRRRRRKTKPLDEEIMRWLERD